MSNVNPYSVADGGLQAAYADESARAGFIRKTYTHLFAAIVALVAIEVLIFAVVPQPTLLRVSQFMTGGYTWLLMLAMFMGVSWVARSWASGGASAATQYAGLSLYVVAEAAILFPMLAYAVFFFDPKMPLFAAIVTLAVFGALTAFVFVTGADFSFLGRFLFLGGVAAMVAIGVGIFAGFSLGLWFSVAMVALAAGYILYDTSNVMHHYRTDQYVAASLALFASVALLFWYVLQIFMSADD